MQMHPQITLEIARAHQTDLFAASEGRSRRPSSLRAAGRGHLHATANGRVGGLTRHGTRPTRRAG